MTRRSVSRCDGARFSEGAKRTRTTGFGALMFGVERLLNGRFHISVGQNLPVRFPPQSSRSLMPQFRGL